MKQFLILLCLYFYGYTAHAQDINPSDSLQFNTDEYFSDIQAKAIKITSRLNSTSLNYLKKLKKAEKTLQKRIAISDSTIILEKADNVDAEYNKIHDYFNDSKIKIEKIQGNYVPLLDSLTTSLNFLNLHNSENISKYIAAYGSIEELKTKINASLKFQELIQERSEFLKQKLYSLGMIREFKKYEKLVFYYQEQFRAYRDLLNQPDKLVEVGLSQLSKLPAFREFFQRNSQLSQLFRLPGSSGTANLDDLAGLQTVSGMQGLLQQRFGLSGSGLQQAMQSPSTNIQNLLSQWKDKVNLVSGQNSDVVIPSFVPNSQRKKSFWNRLEVGGNFQTVRGNAFLPPASDLGLSVAYLVNDKSSIGLGISYKIGFRDSLNKFKVTSQGVGLRSFVDIKLKGSIYITGGGELNYRSEINNIDQLKSFSAWQKSGLLGLTKKVSINKKVRANLQLLWDFLSYNQVPKTSPIIFRFGYIFN